MSIKGMKLTRLGGEVERSMVGVLLRGWVIIVWVPAWLLASQLVPGVVRTAEA